MMQECQKSFLDARSTTITHLMNGMKNNNYDVNILYRRFLNNNPYDLELETDCIVEAIMIPGNEYFATPFNVNSHWYGIVYQNVPKYPIVTGVGIQEGTKVYYRSIN